MPPESRPFVSAILVLSVSTAIAAMGLAASGCASLPSGLMTGILQPGGTSPSSAASGSPATSPVPSPLPSPAPTPAVPPASPPDLVVSPPSGSVDPVPLQPVSGGGSQPGTTPGGSQPIPYPIQTGSPGGSQPMPYPVQPASGASGTFVPAQEALVLQLTNEARSQAGLPALVQTQPLTGIAESRSQDMATRHYFSHVNPDGKTVFDLLSAAGISYTTAGENIAMNSAQASAQTAFTAWMSDQGHKANILSTAYAHIGIGVFQTAGGLSYLTQDFTN